MRDISLSAATGRRLRRLRIDAEVTPEHLAKSAGLTTTVLLNIEDGRAQPSVGTLDRLSTLLGVSLAQVVRDAKRAPAVTNDALPSDSERIGRAIVELPDGANKLRLAEMAAVRYALEVTKGNKSAAARLLGIKEKAMGRRCVRLGRRS